MNNKKISWCSNCLAMSTRPRITFNAEGLCNACTWAVEKKHINWRSREIELENLLNQHRSKVNLGGFDCLVPVSGGKDGSYVAHTLKTKYGMNPLAITITPPLPLELGEKNLRAFVESGFNHISVNPDYEVMRMINLIGFREMGFPYYGWLIAIQAGVVRMASQLNIKLIFYGEDGEVEYGGSNQTRSSPIYDVNYMKAIYLEGGYDKILKNSEIQNSNLFFFDFPSDDNLKNSGINMTHWSYYENWDPYRNYLVAKEHCGLIEAEINNSGTFTNFAQNDQALYALHAYLMYLKFGFGRATQDACIEIRRGAMTRDQAVNLVRLYDGQYPSEFISMYLDYYKLTLEEFGLILDRWVNRDLFVKKNGLWKPSFTIQ